MELTFLLFPGVWNTEFVPTGDGFESDLQVNVLAPALLSVLLLPNLRLASGKEQDAPAPHLTFVASGLHEMAKFPERKLGRGQIVSALNDPKKVRETGSICNNKDDWAVVGEGACKMGGQLRNRSQLGGAWIWYDRLAWGHHWNDGSHGQDR